MIRRLLASTRVQAGALVFYLSALILVVVAASCATGEGLASDPKVGVWVDPQGRGTCFFYVTAGGTNLFDCVR